MSKFEVIRGVEGCCLALDDTRIAGPKPWGGGMVIHAWETDATYKAEQTCRNEWAEFGKFRCSECWTQVDAISTNTTRPTPIKYCPTCGAKVTP